jgi:GMP synthase (glutamine-hydrolysing)
MTDIHASRILILDFGSQYTQLIARRVREIGVYCEIRAWDMTEAEIRDFSPRGIVLSGGPESVPEPGSPRAPDCVFSGDWPVLGICYGMQTMAEQLGGAVQGSPTSEFGYAQIRIEASNPLFHDIRDHVGEGGRASSTYG